MSVTPQPIFERYWQAYGGWGAVLRSRYLHAALVLTPFCWGTWGSAGWWDTVISVLPNLLGFTLGGFAIFVGFGDDRFKASLAAPEADPNSPTVFREFCATFVHFILVQLVALLCAIIAKGMYFMIDLPEAVAPVLVVANMVWGGLCYAIFLYALTSIAAIGLHVFRIAAMYETLQRIESTRAKTPSDD